MVHVYPVGDLREHDTTGVECWCHPEIDADEGVTIHHSTDGRENVETGKLLVQ